MPFSDEKSQIFHPPLVRQHENETTLISAPGSQQKSWLCLMPLPVTGNAKFANMSTFIKGILTIFHSNADREKIYSLVNKNKTDINQT